MARRRTLQVLLSILGLFLVGTVVVLSSISFYLAIDTPAYLTEEEVGPVENGTRWNATVHGKVERIPRILHQTWKTEILPDRWKGISQECRDLMPDYEYMLWTDASSRAFIVKEYPWFLETFDTYKYPIQRADAIRYFVLHFYGGVYLDLDVGCLRPLDRLLVYPVILPKTIPVGVSNDLMFAEKDHPFLAQTIRNLVLFDHSWILNYPTVMFSTGPMFLSAQYGSWTSLHPATSALPGGEVRILPKSLYGKNAKPGEAPHAFFSHYYGSSWHADDAAFIGFLGKWGKGLLWIGLVVLVLGVARLVWQKQRKGRDGAGRVGGYDILMPRSYQRNGRWHVDLGLFTMTARVSAPTSPISPSDVDEESLPILPFSLQLRPPSPAASESSGEPINRAARRSSTVGAIIRVGNRVMTSIAGGRRGPSGSRSSSSSRRGWPSRGVLFFLPAIFTPSGTPPIELGSRRSSETRLRPASRAGGSIPPEKQRREDHLDEAGLLRSSSATLMDASSPAGPSTTVPAAPPPYLEDGYGPPPNSAWSADGGWEEWESR